MRFVPLCSCKISVQARSENLWQSLGMHMMTQEHRWQAGIHHQKCYSVPKTGLVSENCLFTEPLFIFKKYFWRSVELTWCNKQHATVYVVTLWFLPSGGVGTTKALRSTEFLGSVTSTFSPADTTSSLIFPVRENNTGGSMKDSMTIKTKKPTRGNHGLIYTKLVNDVLVYSI